ncbi:DUF2142 domain-containing protein [Methanobacterium sp.]|uniref:DUF2142 domain-containing protein n=1 Tax=Methanobacterium sp. TaxID=2164 RepID=UPI003C70AD67
MNRIKSLNPQYVFIVLGLIYGIAFLVLIPPFQVPDEYEHYYKSWDLSNGNLVPEKIGNKAGVSVPESVKIMTDNVYQKWKYYILNNQSMDMEYLLNLPLQSRNNVFVDISKYAVVTYSPLPYLASALSMALGKLFDLSPLILMYLGRFGNLLLWLFIIFLAIRITPVFKWGFLAIALMPMTLFQASSLSADGIAISLSFLTIAIFLKLALDDNIKKIRIQHILIMILISLLLSLAKMPYIMLILLFFLIPSKKFESRMKMFQIFGLMFLLAVLIVALWNFMVNGLYMPLDPGISIKDQLFYILQYPLDFIETLLNTSSAYAGGLPSIVVGNWAYANSPIPNWIYGIYFFGLVLIAAFDKSSFKMSIKQKYVILGSFLLITGTVFVLEYLTWTYTGAQIIHGIQGRYLIPILPLLFLSLYENGTITKNRILIELMIILFIILILSKLVFIFIGQYYALYF